MPARPLPDDQRRRDLASIHIARKDLGMAEDTYRALLWTIGRAQSAADLDHAGRARVLDHMRACGWKPAAKPGRKPVKPRAAHAAQAAKVEALCAAMKLPLAYALGIASRQTRRDVQSLAWLQWHELRAVIAALMVHQRTHHPETVERRPEQETVE